MTDQPSTQGEPEMIKKLIVAAFIGFTTVFAISKVRARQTV